jgi:hypothetical protein
MGSVLKEPKVLLVEGQDECNFFKALFEHMGVDHVEAREVKGKDNLPAQFEAFLNDPGFPRVTVYAVVQDADTGHSDAFAAVQRVLRKHREPCPARHAEFVAERGRRVGIYIMPGNTQTGMLEDLCLSTVVDHPAKTCIDGMFGCLSGVLEPAVPIGPLEQNKFYMPRNPAKAKAQMFVGLGALKHYWNFNHVNIEPLKRFLEGFR